MIIKLIIQNEHLLSCVHYSTAGKERQQSSPRRGLVKKVKEVNKVGKREMLELALEILGKSCLYGIPSGILGGLIGCVLAALCK